MRCDHHPQGPPWIMCWGSGCEPQPPPPRKNHFDPLFYFIFLLREGCVGFLFPPHPFPPDAPPPPQDTPPRGVGRRVWVGGCLVGGRGGCVGVTGVGAGSHPRGAAEPGTGGTRRRRPRGRPEGSGRPRPPPRGCSGGPGRTRAGQISLSGDRRAPRHWPALSHGFQLCSLDSK